MNKKLRPVVVITTKDRPALLAKAIESVLVQTVNCQLVVVDDGSADLETQDLVTSRYPNIVFRRNRQPLGIIKARNAAVELYEGDIVFTLDDDAVFGQADLVANVLKDFEIPFVGMVTIPVIDHIPDRPCRQRLPINEKRASDYLCSHSFSGGANAIRLDAFKSIGGYIGDGRQGEERGLAIRMIENGLFVKVAECCHIDHYPCVIKGKSKKVHYFNIRNSIIFGWMLVPMPQLLLHIVGTLITHCISAIKQYSLLQFLMGLGSGLFSFFQYCQYRKPVSSSVYSCYRALASAKTFPVSQLLMECQRAGIKLNQS